MRVRRHPGATAWQAVAALLALACTFLQDILYTEPTKQWKKAISFNLDEGHALRLVLWGPGEEVPTQTES